MGGPGPPRFSLGASHVLPRCGYCAGVARALSLSSRADVTDRESAAGRRITTPCSRSFDILQLRSYSQARSQNIIDFSVPRAGFIPLPFISSKKRDNGPESPRNFPVEQKHEKEPPPHFRRRPAFRVDRRASYAWRLPFNGGAEANPPGVCGELPASPLRLHLPRGEGEPLHRRLPQLHSAVQVTPTQ